VGAILIQVLAAVGVFVPVTLLFVLASTSGSDTGAGFFGLICLGFLATIAATIFYMYIYIKWALVVPAIMVEDLGAREGLRRSWKLVDGYWWRTVGLVVLLALLSSVIAGGPAVIFTLLFVAIFRTLDIVLITIVSGVISVLIAALFVPLQLIAMTLYYFDLRVRKEGFDLETAMAQRYWPQYGYPYASPYGGPPLGWSTGQGQYPQGGPTTPGSPAPPLLGQTSSQGYGYGYGYATPPPAEPAVDTAPGQAVPQEDTSGTPTVRVEPDLVIEEHLESAETDMGQTTSPTPGWLTDARPPVLGVRPGGDEALPAEGSLQDSGEPREGDNSPEKERPQE
jgi:hypothetical protein